METARIAFAPSRLFGLRAIQFDHFLVERALIGGIPVRQRVGDLAVHVLHRFEHAFAKKTRFVAIPQFHRLVLARGCAAGNNRSSDNTARQ